MKKVFRVEGLECANCAAKMERGINALPGVTAATLSFMTGKLTIEANEDSMAKIVAEAGKIVSRVEPGVTLKQV